MSPRVTRALALLGISAAVACGGPGAKAPHGSAAGLASSFGVALRTEALGDQVQAEAQYARTVDAAAAAGGDPRALLAVLASLDALAERDVTALSDATVGGALFDRTAPTPRGAAEAHLATSAGMADDPFTKGLLARTLAGLAARRGDAQAAERWRQASGCAREATVIGPVDWAVITGVADADPLARFDAPIAASYASPGPFARPLPPVVVRGRGCAIPMAAASPLNGVRDVVVDVTVPKEQDIGVALRTDSAATLRVGGAVAVRRGYDLGGDDVVRFARVHVGAGRVRLVARIGATGSSDLQMAAWDEHGDALAMHAPGPGERANARATRVAPVTFPAPVSDDDRVLYAAGMLASGDGHAAERALHAAAARPDASPALLLVYGRALETAQDVSLVHRIERERTVYDRLLEKWPGAWEAILMHARLAADRKGMSEARVEALKDLETHRAKAPATARPLLAAFEAAIAGREGLHGRAHRAFEEARKTLDGTSLLHDVSRIAFGRTAAESLSFECAATPGNDRSGLGCYAALRGMGRHAEAARELDRLRQVLGQPRGFMAITLRDALGLGDLQAARRAYDALLPGEHSLGTLAALRAAPDAGPPAITPAQVLALAPVSRDAPGAIPSLMRALGRDPAAQFDGVAEKLAAEDRVKRKLADAATALLQHTEKYEIYPGGVVHYVMFDVRRVSGTTDVEQNAAALPPALTGRSTARILRRRIYKKDGRVLEPDRTPNAAQSHADLAQLEEGDVVEVIYEGWAVPGETGDVGIDTPDLLPERTAIAQADIEIRMPRSLHGSMWVHPLLGKAAETTEGDQRVLRWHMADHPTRRLEYGVPKMDRDVSVSFSTSTWKTVARSLRETIAGLDDDDAEVAAWAAAAAAGKAPRSRELVSAVVARAGETVREAEGGVLSDIGIGRSQGPQTTTARSILVDREGSRTWLIVKALRDLGVPVDVVVAENDPYSADPNFPAHYGRFQHPLAVAHVPSAADPKKTEDVWIDADVSGPPLPAGRISPELRGRIALYPDGGMRPVPDLGGAKERDEVDVRLAIDAEGNARGDLTVLLRGRAAQQISEALFRLVGFQRERALRGIALGWVPFANVEDVQLSSSEGSWQVALRAHITVQDYAQPEGQKTRTWLLPGIDPVHYVFPRPQVATLGATYASEGARENALSVSRAVQYHVHRRIELPKGAQVVRAPGPLDVRSPNLVASRAITVDGSAIDDEFILAVNTGTVAANRYAGFVSDAHRIDDGFLASTSVKPPAKP